MRVQALTGVWVLAAGFAATVPPAHAVPTELAVLAGGAVSNMGSGRGIPITVRAHAVVESGTSYGLEGGYVDWGRKSQVCATGQVTACEDGLESSLGFLTVSGKWRSSGDDHHAYFGFGVGVFRRAEELLGENTQNFGGGFNVTVGYEKIAPFAPAAEITLRVAGADRDMLSMIGLSVGVNWMR